MKTRILKVAAAAILVIVATAGGKREAQNEPEVKNIILMIGDGMGLAQVTSLMIDNEYQPINIERATVGGFVKTYSANNRVTDSAASATTYATGHKTNNSYLSVDTLGSPLSTILEKAEERGMATGLVASIYIQHATPAAFYAHNTDRGQNRQIALDLVGSGVDVAIGGGMRYLTKENLDDGRDLRGELERKGYIMADSLGGLDNVSEGNAMALVDMDIPLVAQGRDPQYLPAATAKALEILTNNSKGNGFFLMVEGSHIDHACHANDAKSMIPEVRDFDNAVGVALDYAEAHPGTLVIILADHETGGLSIPSGNADFLRAESGIEFNWGTGGHSAVMVPLFAYGPRAEYFSGVLENDEVGRRMQKVLGLWENPLSGKNKKRISGSRK